MAGQDRMTIEEVVRQVLRDASDRWVAFAAKALTPIVAAQHGSGVAPQDIAADYELSTEHLRARYAARREPDESVALKEFLARQGTTAAEFIITALADCDIEAILRDAGLNDHELAALRDRLLSPRR